MSSAPATRALARLAWRELRRRPGRSFLVIALVALPVAALIVGGLLALPAGLIPATVFIHASNEMRFAVPWTALAVLLALPAAAAAGAWLLTRPARWSPPATWAD